MQGNAAMIDIFIGKLAEIVTGLLWAILAVAAAWLLARWLLAPDYVALVAADAVRGSFVGVGR
jgi:hypothetical protein